MLWLGDGGGTIGTAKIVVEGLDCRGVISIIGRTFSTFHRSEGEEKEVIMRSTKICYRVYDVSVRDIPEA